MRKPVTVSLLLFSALIFISSCGALRDAADIREPRVTFSEMTIQNINFDGVTLLFNFDVENPNRFNVNTEQYSYEFFINDQSFLTGSREEPVRIERESSTTVQVPVSLNFSEVYETFSSVLRQDSLSYQLSTEVEFDLALAGKRRVPVTAGGKIPIPRMPQVNFGGVDVKELSFSGAEVEISFSVSNPNPFGISVDNAAYQLVVNGREWLDTTLDQDIRVEGDEYREIKIPIRLGTSQLGPALLEMMSGNTTFNYEVKGEAEVSADIEGFPGAQLFPFELSGQYRLN
ncbi:MAG: LEA type 2 family protein [Balneolaceae bacterium]|nr:LEA type 2 family protein [Balneolaceae bacterium]MCH8549970.1 LEA type 2 family protein [Balneolaceae bacterium]